MEKIFQADADPLPVKISHEDYTELKNGMRYILFLKWSPGSEHYGVYALNYGNTVCAADSSDDSLTFW